MFEYVIATFFAYFSKVSIWHIFPYKLAFSTAILTLIVFLLSALYYVSLPQPSGCQ